MTQPAPQRVQRQIVLPLSKAIEIAWKNIRMRLSRSLLVTSGIVLALAFLMSILTSDAITDAMRGWARSAGDGSARFAELRARRDALDQQINGVEKDLRAGISKAGEPAANAPPFDPDAIFGRDLATIQKETAALPEPEAEMIRGLTADPSLVPKFQQWLTLAEQLKAVKDELTGPQRLEALMKAQGMPTAPDEIVSSRIQTRWLLGLALLVAFVGILNAMLMSVTERFREIGTMKCLGALDSFIVKLFLIESLFQGFVGTMIGVATGLALAMLAMTTTYGHYAWQDVPLGRIFTGVVLCLAVGVGLTVAGAVYPAWQAARMQPIEAMRVET